MVEKKIEKAILAAQRTEITEHFVYQKLSQSAMDPHNKSVLKQISDDEVDYEYLWLKFILRCNRGKYSTGIWPGNLNRNYQRQV
jgi:hypothetical protein